MRKLIPVVLTVIILFVAAVPAAVFGGDLDDPTGPQPDRYVLSAAYPNPFNPSTSFSLIVEDRQEVRVEVFNMLGQRVRLLFEGLMDEGELRTFVFDAGSLPSGIYLYRATGSDFVATRHITLLK